MIHCVRDNLEILDLRLALGGPRKLGLASESACPGRNRLGDEGAKAIADAFKGHGLNKYSLVVPSHPVPHLSSWFSGRFY